ncbi:MAG: GNAT family N-acetyltransferase [Anaerolineales bacterium]
MNAQAIRIHNSPPPANLRPFDMRRDLLSVADLVELCFASSLDADGRLYVRQMRQAARGGPLLDLAAAGPGPMSGYVWQENGKVVGNLSLIPHGYGNRKIMLIANVAVHPEQRRRGIARALTEAALDNLLTNGKDEIWLQVDENNPAAVTLYRNMGFVERTRRTSWRVYPQIGAGSTPAAKTKVRKRHTSDWARQSAWLQSTYPRDLRWQIPLDPVLLQPGWRGSVERALSTRQVRQWSAEEGGELLAALSWQSSTLDADRLWLAAAKENEGKGIAALMRQIHNTMKPTRKLALNYPARRAEDALRAAGFKSARTLIWMEYPKD